MAQQSFRKYLSAIRLSGERKIKLSKYDTAYEPKGISKEMSEELLKESTSKLFALQDKLYAHDKYSILVVFQGMDAAGKDGAVRHVMSGLNPQGVKVVSFKTPTHAELDHDYFWRHYTKLPARGEIGIFNRSHYENVLVTRVHPEYILNERIPGIDDIKKINSKFWDERFKQINRFEKNISDNGTIILKFFLHLSKDEQKRRFMERIDNPKKNWKFSVADLKERGYWDSYQVAFEDMLNNTSSERAPWFVIPADNKWSARLAISEIILQEFEKLHIHYPKVSKAQKDELLKAKDSLLNEK